MNSLLSSPLDEVYAWLTSNRLSVNPSKTEFLIIGNPQQRNKIQSSSIVFCGNVISPSESARNLGVTFDSSLSLTKHISSICKSAHYQIRQLKTKEKQHRAGNMCTIWRLTGNKCGIWRMFETNVAAGECLKTNYSIWSNRPKELFIFIPRLRFFRACDSSAPAILPRLQFFRACDSSV